MTRRPEWWRRLSNLWRRDEFERGLKDEIEFHIDQQTDKNIRHGMDPNAARRAALVRFGGIEPTREHTRDEFRSTVIQDFLHDARIGGRLLRRAPSFAIASIVTFGLGIAAATTVFSVVEGVLLTPLPYPESNRLVRLFEVDRAGARSNVAETNFVDWTTRTRGFASMTEMAIWGLTPVLGGAEATRAAVTAVSRSFFDTMRVHPAAGRPFAEEELRTGGAPAAILSHTYWQQAFGVDTPLTTQTLHIGQRVYRVVGIMPAGFDYPNGTQVWVPRELDPAEASRTAHNFSVVARLADGVTLAQARRDLSAVSRALKVEYGDQIWMADATAIPLIEYLTAASKPSLQVLFGASFLLLLVSCTNVSNLLLARAATRRHEFAVQLAIGAGRLRIARQLLAESFILCLAGGALGVLLSVWGVRGLMTFGAGTAPRLDQVHVDWVVLAFAFGVSTFAAVALALVTSLSGRDLRPVSVLSEGLRTATSGRQSFVAREALVVIQVALTLVLLDGAGLLGRSLQRVLAVDPGFRLDDALVLDVTGAGTSAEGQRRQQIALQDELVARLTQLPGVSHVGLTTGFPLGGGRYFSGQFLKMTASDSIRSFDDFAKLGQRATERAGQAGFRVVSGRYFQTMGIPVLRGRVFEDADGPDAPHVAVISQSLAEASWPNRDPIGGFVQFGNMDGDLRGFRIVGVVGDVRELTTEVAPSPLFYVSYRQRPKTASRFTIIVRGPSPALLADSARRTVHELDPLLPLQIRTVRGAFDRTLTGRRFSLLIIVTFGVAALTLATFGVYALIAYLVAQRTKEMGIRMALGATRAELLRLVVGRGCVLALIGGGLGVAAVVPLTRVVKGMLFAISPTDPAVLWSVVAVTVGAATAASYLPARRAANAEPIVSLRTQ